MDCLYKTATKYTFEEYKRFSRIFLINKQNIIIYILLTILLIIGDILSGNNFGMMFIIIYPVMFVLLHNRQIKKTFYSNKAFQNTEVEFELFDTYIVATDSYGSTKLEYNKLYKIIETKTNFYLMIAKNQGYILVKDNFPDGLAEFLRNIKL